MTCHHMATQVDTGRIIAVKRFPVYPEDDVAALLKRTYENQMALFFEIVQLMADGKELPVSSEKWTLSAVHAQTIQRVIYYQT